MRISYLFNSSLPSINPGSLQVIKTCESLSKFSNQVFLISPNTGLKVNIKKFYGLKKSPKILKIKYFKKFPQGINYYLFSLISIFYGVFFKTDIYITRNLFTLFLLNLMNKKTIAEIHHDLSNEGRIVKFLYNNFKILNSKNILKVIAITNSVKKYLIKERKVDQKKIYIIPSASGIKSKFVNFKIKKSYKIGYFGSFEKSKGSDFIIKLSNLDHKNKYYMFGGNTNEVKKLNKKKKSNNLIIEKYIPYKYLGKFISKMDILLMPSNKNTLRSLGGVGNIAKFTSPLKLFDYLASGKLIVSSKLKVFEEIITNNKDCIMINNLDPYKWLKIIKGLNKKVNKINKIKKNAYLLSKKYSYDNRAKLILKNL